MGGAVVSASGNSACRGVVLPQLLTDSHDLSGTHVGALSFDVFDFNAGSWEAEASRFLLSSSQPRLLSELLNYG